MLSRPLVAEVARLWMENAPGTDEVVCYRSDTGRGPMLLERDTGQGPMLRGKGGAGVLLFAEGGGREAGGRAEGAGKGAVIVEPARHRDLGDRAIGFSQ
ncbi:hypothetical protein UC8_12370 [Roseimaritima ulvae]|uniref:Uncharacterized protein n=1 Tax=Roseimaritima ulvae TaxID=980254 RepID=A0A5B9QQG2_9BACT|nr:hypothetical protein UC8_12370 [Roseimaritima ulvae]